MDHYIWIFYSKPDAITIEQESIVRVLTITFNENVQFKEPGARLYRRAHFPVKSHTKLSRQPAGYLEFFLLLQ